MLTVVMLRHELPASDQIAADADFGGQLVRVTQYNRPTSGNDEAVTAQSIGWMQRLAAADKSAPPIRDAAIAVIADLGYGSSSKRKEIADAIFRWVKRAVRYRHEDDMRTPFSGLSQFLVDQTLIAPAALLRMPEPEGDCVDFSMLTAALCSIFGLRTAYKTIAADPESTAYSHVYVIAELQPGAYYPLDTSNGPAPGMEFDLPKHKKSRLWWNTDRSNEMVSSRRPRPYRPRAYRMGDDPLSDFTPLPLDIVDNTANSLAPYAPIPGWNEIPPGSPSSGGFAQVLSTAVNDATKVLSPIIRQSTIQPPRFITGANGAQVLYDPSTGQMINSPGYASLGLGGINPLLLIGIVVGASALLAFAHK